MAGRADTGKGKKGLRMKDLVEASGLPKSTILYYVEKGLLPPPVKTSPNMAYYDPACVERIDFIRNMQQNYRLPLDKIGRLLERRDRGENVMPLIELGRAVFGEDRGPLVDEESFRQTTGLTTGDMEKLTAARLLLPLQNGTYDQADVAMGQVYAQGLAFGMSLEDWQFYSRLGKEIVDEEMRVRARITGHLPMEEDAAITIRMVQAARATRSYVIDRLFQLRIAAAKDPKDTSILS